MNVRSLPAFAAIATVFLLLGGCATDRVDLREKHQLKVVASSSNRVLVVEPSVWQEEGKTVVYGHVRRAPGAYLVGDGHTHVQVRLADSGITEEQWVSWSPKWIPFHGPRYSTYRVTYPWVAPPGSDVRVWVCFDEHPQNPGGKTPTPKPSL